jgi:hypothetical protein
VSAAVLRTGASTVDLLFDDRTDVGVFARSFRDRRFVSVPFGEHRFAR